ncbi:hypothetical protein [Companilactobacillus bobalius]|uniref:BIG2 domain-containing protein n=2 Tax=Companilactobacillus bobalius TaxID=2801451 RepID=A0A202FCZ1_9LACO|nr:hypothetical protein [Companilactobacillus bobalius]KAE9561729.1 hypothetical protein ATN92_06540 [Companilactobacillus bobalius]KRK82643.1 cell surface SD repeat-containing protein [Companilactobacillus bobalius DSM 19674]OVE98349.1 hypothetical protein LKACC16343_01236 [Companilactobacillus bobalius]GEO57609.1 hypothetical protein LBO01_07380 [Companilactobacillus paralimentarius]
MRKLKKRWLLVLIFISILSASSFNRHYKNVNAQEEEPTEVSPYKKPSGNSTKFLGIRLTNGYSLQPAKETYLEVGQTKTISGNASRSLGTLTLTLALGYTNKKYQWYKSTDGKNWSKDTSSSANKKTLSITPDKVGKTYYQLEVYWQAPGILGRTTTHLYSDLATVNAVPEPVDATSVEVTTDDDYLYNSSNDIVNTDTIAHAHPDPVNFTGTVSWSIDNDKLATIDSETGEIDANTSRLSGVVRVTATLHNPNGSTVSNYKDITIGGGLEDQTVKAGQTATFDLRGNIGDLDEGDDMEAGSDYTVKWYKEDPITHTREQILKDDPKALSYTTPKATLKDDGTLFLAIIQVKYNGKTYSYTTNDAFLYVKPEGGPNLSITNTMENSTFNDGTNTENMLFGVNNGDQIIYHDTLKNNTSGGRLNDATYTLPLRNGTTVKSVKVDGTETDEYKLSKNSTTNATDLTVSSLNFDINESHTIDIETEVAAIEKKDSFSSIPYVSGKDDDGVSYQKIGNQNVINYTLDAVAIKNANDIDYGTLNSVMSEGTLNRQDELNLPNNVVDIEDTRRNKKPVTLSVEQVGEFTNENSDVLSGHLRFYNGKNSYDLLDNPTSIYQTENDEVLNSQGWSRDEGILLYMNSEINRAGTYRTTLSWEISDSV